jgi:hypothetical protein
MPTAWRAWLRGTDAQLIGLTLLTKVLLFAWGLLAWAAAQGHGIDIGQALVIWNRWDAPHYLDLAIWGYMAVDPGVSPTFGNTGDMDLMMVFYPLFPALIGAVRLAVPDLVAPILVSSVTSVAAVLLLYRVVAAELGEAAGRRAAIFLLIFPTAYFLHIGYTESLFLALVLGSFLATRHGRWAVAGLSGGLAALTRVNGLALIPSLVVEAWSEWRTTRRWRLGWLAIGGVALGFGGYLLVNQLVYGDPLAFITVQREHWFKELAWPWEGIGGVVSRAMNGTLEDRVVLGWAELVAIGLGLVGTVVSVLRFRASWSVWMAVNLLLFVSTSFVLSVPRYALVLFPLYAWLAVLAERRWLGTALGVGSVILLLWFSARFATGAWAF